MADFPFMPLATDAYIADTMHLSLEEHGAYLKLLMIMWRTPDGWLDDDDKRLAMMLGVTVARWRKLRATLGAFFIVDGGRLTQKKLQKMRENVAEKSAQASRAAEVKWLKYNNTKSADAPATKTKTKEEKKEDTLRVSKKDAAKAVEPQPAKQASEPKARAKRKTALPAGWVDEMPDHERQAAIRHGLDPPTIEFHWGEFTRGALTHGRVYMRWDLAWITWMGNIDKFSGGRKNGHRSHDSDIERDRQTRSDLADSVRAELEAERSGAG